MDEVIDGDWRCAKTVRTCARRSQGDRDTLSVRKFRGSNNINHCMIFKLRMPSAIIRFLVLALLLPLDRQRLLLRLVLVMNQLLQSDGQTQSNVFVTIFGISIVSARPIRISQDSAKQIPFLANRAHIQLHCDAQY